jgi:predicted TIM-barrel fold metal-dependent hydrolase
VVAPLAGGISRVIIDTECHVLFRTFPRESNPDRPITTRASWHEYSGDLFAAEMERSGVDKGFLISYDADDIRWYLEETVGGDATDFYGGRKYTLESAVKKYPDRFLWFATLKNPTRPDTLARMQKDFADGALGMKIFPAYSQLPLDDPSFVAIYRAIAEAGRRIIFSFEDTVPGKTPGVADYWHQLDWMLGEFPTIKVQINHAGAGNPDDPVSDPLNPAARLIFDVVGRHSNVWLSTAYLGKVWDDESEYPYPNYLARLESLRNGVGASRLFWATDWPWLEAYQNYPQAVNCITRHASFFTEDERRAFLGENAFDFIKDLLPGYEQAKIFGGREAP